MSLYRAVKALGSPYFAFVSGSLQSNAQNLPEDGLASLTVQAAFHGLPKQLASADESHPIVAFGDYGKPAPASNVMSIGISPSGRIIGTTMFGDVVMTPGGTISGIGGWHNIQLVYDYGFQSLVLTVDSLAPVELLPTAGLTPALPTHSGLVMLFNGTSAISHMRASIRDASLTFFSTLLGGAATVHYALDDQITPTLEASLTGDAWAALGYDEGDFLLSPVWFNPTFYAPPWGVIPQTNPNTGFVWDVLTPYTKRVMPTTEYRKVVASS